MTHYTGPITVHFLGRRYTVWATGDGWWEWQIDGPPPRVGGRARTEGEARERARAAVRSQTRETQP
jgi:hypothetical protein